MPNLYFKRLVIVVFIFLHTLGYCQEKEEHVKWHNTKLVKATFTPLVLTGLGLFVHNSKGVFGKHNIQEKIQGSIGTDTNADDYLQYYSFAALLMANAVKVDAAHDFKNQLFVTFKAHAIMTALVVGLKSGTNVSRPDGGAHSMPSGHTAMSFTTATILYHEYKDYNKLLAASGYVTASLTGLLRVTNNKHWMSDVLIGAGLGMLVTNLVYLHHDRIKKRTKKPKSQLTLLPQSHDGYGIQIMYKF